jgi:hypothetical protein
MPGTEYPIWGDKRLKFGMPGLRYGRPLPSYITHPVDLTHRLRRHDMQLPSDPDAKETLGFNAADGVQQYEASLPLLANTHGPSWPTRKRSAMAGAATKRRTAIAGPPTASCASPATTPGAG